MFAVPNDSTALTGIDQAIENHIPVTRLLSPYQNTCSLVESFDHNVMFGMNLTQFLADDTFYGQVTQNPGKPVILNVFFGNAGGAITNTSAARFEIVIELDVTFKQAFVLATS